jgi:hypothetical protein
MRFPLIKLPLALLFLLTGMNAMAQQIAPLGHWTSYLSHYEVTEITNRFNRIYCITPGGIFYYDEDTQESRATTKVEGLSGVNPTTIYYAPQSDYVFVGFPNGMINFFKDPDELGFITDIERSQLFTARGINEFLEYDGSLYIATDFGLVVYDINENETRYSVNKIGTNNTGTSVKDLAIIGDSIWVSVGAVGLYSAWLGEANLTVPTVWKKRAGIEGMPLAPCDFMAQVTDTLYALIDDTIFVKRPNVSWDTTLFIKTNYTFLGANEGHVMATHEGACEILYPDGLFGNQVNNGTLISAWIHNGTAYIGDKFAGLLTPGGTTFTRLSPRGPSNNYVSEIAVGNREFYIAPRGRKGPSDRYNDHSGIYYYSLDSGWKVLDELTEGLSNNTPNEDFARAIYDDKTQIAWLGSWGDGIMSLKNGDTLASFHNQNSPISVSSQGDSSARVSGMAIDERGTLWITLVSSDNKINSVTSDGVWHVYPGLNNSNPVGLILDDYGNKWTINNQAGLTVFNENDTPTNFLDDKVVNLNSSSGNGGIPNNSVFSLAKDLDGQIWVGTSEGATVFYDPGSVFSATFPDASCPIIEGFCLLRDQKVNTIAIDGANRKWMGTDNGVYVISDDGTEEEMHFTTENSSLIDNVIIDIAIDGSTGEVLIGTQSGLVSYIGDATEGQETSDSLFAFPNPVRVDYTGQITIRGSVAEAKVKITTMAGDLVRELESKGGETIWDLKDTWGNTVTPGIYLALIADRDGLGPGITKIAVIERMP